MAHFNFVISQNAKWGHAGFYIDCHRMAVPENILLQKKYCCHTMAQHFLTSPIHACKPHSAVHTVCGKRHKTVECPSVCPVDQQQRRRPAGLLLRSGADRPIDR